MKSIRRMSDLELQAEYHRADMLDRELGQQIAENRLCMKEIEKEQHRREASRALTGKPRVTDHALLRYLERIVGVDVEAARGEIMSKGLSDAAGIGATRYSNGKGVFVLKNGTVVTTLER